MKIKVAIRCTVLSLLLLVVALPLSAKTWFVRVDGGTRHSAAMPSGQCDGLADAAYRGHGTNEHCAFNNAQWLYLDGAYGASNWVMSGGDTAVIRGCAALPNEVNPSSPHCRIGWVDPKNAYGICHGPMEHGCSMPPPPNGTPGAHTRILSGCAYDGNCNPVIAYPYTSNNLTQLFGGFNIAAVLILDGGNYIDVEGFEITSHNGACTRVGYPSYPAACSTSAPMSDFATSGITTTSTTTNLTLQDLYIHGLVSAGIYGPIGKGIVATRVSIDFNTSAGWNFDDGRSTPDGPGASITASNVRMEGNGCLEEYPIVHTQFPALSCWDTEDGGFGDSWSGQNTKLDSFVCDHCVMAYNTKDGFTGPHTGIGYLKIINSESYGNMGQQWKWATMPNSTTIFENNLTIGNCRRMSQPMPGASASYNRFLSGFCRAAGDVFAFITGAHSTVLFANNTMIGYSATMFDVSCWQSKTCDSSSFIFRNNIVLGFLNPRNNPAEVPGLFYYSDPSIKINLDHDIFYNLRSKPCPTFGHSDLICASPAFVGQPSLTLGSEGQLDPFNFHPASGSPAIRHGIAVNGLTTDSYGNARSNPPTIGAVEPNR